MMRPSSLCPIKDLLESKNHAAAYEMKLGRLSCDLKSAKIDKLGDDSGVNLETIPKPMRSY